MRRGADDMEPPPPPEERRDSVMLLDSWLHGDESAFTELYERHAAVLRRSVALRMGRRVRDMLDVEDVVDETFAAAAAWVREHGFAARGGEGGFRHLLAKIALQKLADTGRAAGAAKRDVARRRPISDLGSVLVDPTPRPSEEARAAEIEAKRDAAILAMAAGDRELLDMRHNLGMSSADIAAALELKRETVRVRLSRAGDRLRQALRRLRD